MKGDTMLKDLIKGIGGLVRDTVEAGDAVVTGVIDYGKRLDDVIENIPELLNEGYHEGLFTEGDNAKPEIDESKIVKRPTNTNDSDLPAGPDGFKRPEAQ